MVLKMYDQKGKENALKQVHHIVAVLGGKGGVGKSTVTLNLALALSKRGRKVGILDADIYGPSIPYLMGGSTLGSIERHQEKIVPPLIRGVRVMSVAFFKKRKQASVVRAPIANRIIEQFLSEVFWGDLDDLLIDFPPGTGDIQITLMQKACLSGSVMVTTPQEIALIDVRKSMQMCFDMEVPVLGIVENMSYFLHKQSKERIALFGEGGGKLLADEWEVPLIGQVPIDPMISILGDQGESIFENKTFSSESFCEIAARLESALKKVECEEGFSSKHQKWVWDHE